MKRHIFYLLYLAVIYGCSENPYVVKTYQMAADKYEGEYIVTDLITEGHVVYDLFGDNMGENHASDDLYSQYEWRLSLLGGGSVGQVNLLISTYDGTGVAHFGFVIQSIEPEGMPPYTVDSPVSLASHLASATRDFLLTVNQDGSITWSSGEKKKDGYNSIELSLLGAAEVVSFSDKSMDVHFEEFPIYDHISKKTVVIPVTYHLERHRN